MKIRNYTVFDKRKEFRITIDAEPVYERGGAVNFIPAPLIGQDYKYAFSTKRRKKCVVRDGYYEGLFLSFI